MRKHRSDKIIALVTIILMLVGLIVVYAIGGRVAQAENAAAGKNYNELYFFTRHAAVVVMSIVALFAAYKAPYSFFDKYAKRIFWGAAALCLLVTVLGRMNVGLVTCDEGACRSFYLPVISVGFAPVELLKLGVLFYGARLIKTRKQSGELGTTKFWVPFATMFLVTVVFVGWWQKDFGSTIVIAVMMLAMAFVGGVSLKQLGIAMAALALCAGVLIMTQQHRIDRIMGWEGSGNSYHKESSLISLGTGGLMGVGLGNSIQSSGYLPESLTDSIFSIIGEIWGFAGTALIVLAYILLLKRIIRVGEYTEDTGSSLFAVGLFAWLVSHVIINIGGMTGIIPMKGITLPFLSYGGTSMLFAAFAVGIVLQISGWTKRKIVNEDSSGRWGQRGTRYSSSSSRS